MVRSKRQKISTRFGLCQSRVSLGARGSGHLRERRFVAFRGLVGYEHKTKNGGLFNS